MDAVALSYCDLNGMETASLSDSLLTARIILQASGLQSDSLCLRSCDDMCLDQYVLL